MPHPFAALLADFFKSVVPQPADVGLETMALKALDARPPRRKSMRYYPSEVNNPYSCPRKAALMRIEEIFTDRQREEPKRVRLMEEGTVLHRYVQTELLGPSGSLFGHWRCKSCRRTIHEFRTYPGEFCPNLFGVVERLDPTRIETEILGESCEAFQRRLIESGEAAWEYEEIRLKHAVLDLSGRVDGVIIDRADPSRWYTLELKTTGALAFRGLDEHVLRRAKRPELPSDLDGLPVLVPARAGLPKAYHVSQGAIYSELLLIETRAGRIPLSPGGYRGTLIAYINRDGLAMKVFLRRNSEAALEAARVTIEAIEYVRSRADLVKRDDPAADLKRVEANRRLTMELTPACRDRNDDRALTCPWRTAVCFPYKQVSKNKLEFMV